MSEYTLAAQIAAVKREIALRERAYPKWVANARMKPERAVFEIGAMKAVLATLLRIQDGVAMLASGGTKEEDRPLGWNESEFGSGNNPC